MGRTQRQDRPLDTIWEIDDELWQRIEPILWEDAPATPKAHGGRPRIDWRCGHQRRHLPPPIGMSVEQTSEAFRRR